MIDNLISDPMKKIGLIWRYILKVMNFLIYRDFLDFSEFFIKNFGIFLNFAEFK